MARSSIPRYVEAEVRLSRFATNWLQSLAASGFSPETLKNYDIAQGQLVAYLTQVVKVPDSVVSFTAKNVEGFKVYLAEHRMLPQSIAIKLSALNQFAKWLMRQEDTRGQHVLAANPFDRVERPRRRQRERPYLHRDELIAFASMPCKPHEAIARDVLLATMLRASELCRLNVGDLVEVADGRLAVRVTLKGGRQRTVGLPGDLGERLAATIEARGAGPADPLLVNSRGFRFTRMALSDTYSRMAQRAGLNRVAVRAHQFRHALNVIARSVVGLDVQQRAAMLNHVNTNTLAKYDHAGVDEAQDARDATWQAVQKLVATRVPGASEVQTIDVNVSRTLPSESNLTSGS